MHLEALVRRLALAVAVRERLERRRAPLARLADRREEERLHHPRRRRLDEVRAGDEQRVVARRARPAAPARAGRRSPARTASSRAAARRRRGRRRPTRPNRPRFARSSAACRPRGRCATATRRSVADARRRLERRSGQPGDPRGHAASAGAILRRSGGSQHELGRLGPRREAERHERRAEPGRDVHPRRLR